MFYEKMLQIYFVKNGTALPGVTRWIERRPANQSVAGLIPSQDTCLICRPDLQ